MIETNRFNFHCPTEIISGLGSRCALPEMSEVAGRSCMLLSYPGFQDRELLNALESSCDTLHISDVFEENPSVMMVRSLAEKITELGIETIIAIGGGSTIDTAKAVLWFADNPIWNLTGENSDLKPVTRPVIAVPTTAGTGSEVTPYAILTDAEKRKKILNHSSMIPRIAVCDPELTVTMPQHVTAHTGIDAICHAIEAYLSRSCNGVLEDLAQASIARGSRALPAVLAGSGNLSARSEMMLSALEGGMVLAHCGTVMVHALGYCLTGAFGYPHGLSNALLLPAFLDLLVGKGCERAQYVSSVFGDDLLGFIRKCGVNTSIPLVDEQTLNEWVESGYASYGRPNCVADLEKDDIEQVIKNTLEEFK